MAPRTRDEVVTSILAEANPFTTRDMMARCPGVPEGTFSSILACLHAGGALRRMFIPDPSTGRLVSRWQRSSRMPRTVDGARALVARMREESEAKRNGKRRRTAPKPPAPRQMPLTVEPATDLVARISEWRDKAATLDRLVADLGLTGDDLRPYRDAR